MPPGWGPTYRWSDVWMFPDDDAPLHVPLGAVEVWAIERNDRVLIVGRAPGEKKWSITLLYPNNTGWHQWTYPAHPTLLTHQMALDMAADQVDSWGAAGLIP